MDCPFNKIYLASPSRIYMNIEHSVSRARVGIVPAILHRNDFLCVSPPTRPNVVGDLQRGFVDEKDAFLHEVQQTALRFVHAAHEREPARRSEIARRVQLHATDELEELRDEFVALVAHFGLQFALIPLVQHVLRSNNGSKRTSLRLRESE